MAAVAKRNPAADILRCLAFFFVVSVHFLLNSGFYNNTVESQNMLIMLVVRSLFITCVPLFMTLSGYLMREKKLSADYYKKAGKTYFAYVLASIACIVFAVAYNGQEWTFFTAIDGILEFRAAPYAWYIEMYLGLFCIIPFLNLLYNNIPSRKWKRNLLIILSVVVFLPSVVNVYNFESLDWWTLPSSSTEYLEILPNWWGAVLYPVVYYFAGCYLNEYKIRMNKWINLFLIVYVAFVTGVYNYWRSFRVLFIWGSWCQYFSLFTFIMTVLVFIFVINRNYDKMPSFVGKAFEKVSGLCMNAYLVSWIFDQIFYPMLKERITDIEQRFPFYFAVVPIVFILSLLLSYVLKVLQTLLTDAVLKLIGLFRKKKQKDDTPTVPVVSAQ